MSAVAFVFLVLATLPTLWYSLKWTLWLMAHRTDLGEIVREGVKTEGGWVVMERLDYPPFTEAYLKGLEDDQS
jgi:hypothetical protein